MTFAHACTTWVEKISVGTNLSSDYSTANPVEIGLAETMDGEPQVPGVEWYA
ncbi:MAG TPA: hypothetical protein VFB34_08425 [Chloroflexota bacterium]|nr:hypothetical protein [Chloroflexota bacterium]